MIEQTAPPPLPNYCPDCNIVTNSLNDTFNAMLLDPPVVSPNNFSNEWGATDTEEALALSGVDDARLKDCIVSALASVWDVPTMRPAQIEACYHLLHPPQTNALGGWFIGRGGGGDAHTPHSWSNQTMYHFNLNFCC